MIDARGLACPMPVLMVQKEVSRSSPGSLEVMVDNHSARENVRRFAEGTGYTVAVAEENGDYRLTLTK